MIRPPLMQIVGSKKPGAGEGDAIWTRTSPKADWTYVWKGRIAVINGAGKGKYRVRVDGVQFSGKHHTFKDACLKAYAEMNAVQSDDTVQDIRVRMIKNIAMAMAETQGVDWKELPDTEEDAAPNRSPDCCNLADCKTDWLQMAEAAYETMLTKTTVAAIKRGAIP